MLSLRKTLSLSERCTASVRRTVGDQNLLSEAIINWKYSCGISQLFYLTASLIRIFLKTFLSRKASLCYNIFMTLKQYSVLLARISLFVIYFWFGFLKIIGLSPASGLVQELFKHTLAHIPVIKMIAPAFFVVGFGFLEVLLGILFLIPGKERLATKLFFFHIFTTALPLVFLLGSVWQKFMVPTLEGQYIIKNLALVACVLNILSSVPRDVRS